jgi:hypothetical protein
MGFAKQFSGRGGGERRRRRRRRRKRRTKDLPLDTRRPWSLPCTVEADKDRWRFQTVCPGEFPKTDRRAVSCAVAVYGSVEFSFPLFALHSQQQKILTDGLRDPSSIKPSSLNQA